MAVIGANMSRAQSVSQTWCSFLNDSLKHFLITEHSQTLCSFRQGCLHSSLSVMRQKLPLCLPIEVIREGGLLTLLSLLHVYFLLLEVGDCIWHLVFSYLSVSLHEVLLKLVCKPVSDPRKATSSLNPVFFAWKQGWASWHIVYVCRNNEH